MSYAAYKGLAISYLIRGINVAMIDYRGYGKSTGSPTDDKTKLDLETVYQFLSEKHHVKNEHIIVHGHCLASGPASDLAARRQNVNIILDRGFAEYRDVAQKRFPLIEKIVHALLPQIVDYNVSKNIQNIRGHIAIEIDTRDDVIPEDQWIKNIDHLPSSKRGEKKPQVIKLMDSDEGHAGLWTRNRVTAAQFSQFLEQTHLRRRLF